MLILRKVLDFEKVNASDINLFVEPINFNEDLSDTNSKGITNFSQALIFKFSFINQWHFVLIL